VNPSDFRHVAKASSESLMSVLLLLDRSQPDGLCFTRTQNVTRDPALKVANFNAQDYVTLVAHPSPFQKFLEELLCLVRLSLHYTLDGDTYPSFMDKDREDMDIFTFFYTFDPTKVKVVKREREEDELQLLETTVSHTIPLLLVAPNHGESELEATVDKLFDEGGSAKASKEKETVVSDAGEPSHPPKKLRKDYESLSGASLCGKSWSMI
ncbi:hypothetical protein Tco_0382160, partial [Tanacetum coccineum]